MSEKIINTERWIYLDAFQELAKTRNLGVAVELRQEWQQNASEKNMASAALYYLRNFVIPVLINNEKSQDLIPRWVQEHLFSPPEPPTTIHEFCRLFDSYYIEALNERKHGKGIVLGSKLSSKGLFPLEGDLCHNQDKNATYPPNLKPGEIPLDWFKDQNLGLYFTPNPIDGTEMSDFGSMRLDCNVKRFSSCFADFDGGDKVSQMLTIQMLCPPPTMIVESKNGYHVYFMLADEITEPEWRRLQQGIIAVCGSDKAIKNPSRLMRLPFTWHCKTDDKFYVNIAKFDWRRYTKQELANHFRVDLNPLPKVYNLPGDYKPPRDLKVPSVTHLGEGNRHPTLTEETARIYANLPQEKAGDARRAILEWYRASCKPLKKTWEKEVNDMADHFERKEYGTIVSR